MKLYDWIYNRFFEGDKFNSDEEIENTNRITTDNRDGALEVSTGGGQFSRVFFNGDWSYNSQADLIDTYRTISMYNAVHYAIEDIVNEAVSFSEDEDAVIMDLTDIDQTVLSENIKKKVHESFDKVYRILDLNNTIHQRLRLFYIDGRAAYQSVINLKAPKKGLVDAVELDVRDITYIRELDIDQTNGVVKGYKESFVYNRSGTNRKSKKDTDVNKTYQSQSITLNSDSIVYVTSGLTDPMTGYSISWLHNAVKPANQQRMMENALLIYRIVRAPERRVFTLNMSGIPASKRESELRNTKNNYRNQMSFDPEKGMFKDERHLMTMQEDYWLPAGEDGPSTTIDTLPEGKNLSDIDDVLYFQKELYKALNVPLSRLDNDSTFSFGRQSEISRDELKFSKLVSKIRQRFSMIILGLVKTDLILSNIITEKEWESFYQDIKLIYSQDLYLEEMRKNELYTTRLELVEAYEKYIGKYVSNEFIRTEVLKQTENDIKEQDKLIQKEKENKQYYPTESENEF